MKLGFYGAVNTVTGSKTLVMGGGVKVLVDCGLFQGLKIVRQRNWAPLPFSADSLDAVVLTHAHIDHSGLVPLLVKNGYRGPIYATPATKQLCRIMLPDAGHLQEEEAKWANKRGYSKHSPAMPLYTRLEAEACLPQIQSLSYGENLKIGGLNIRLRRAGHILGAASVRIDEGKQSILFSGDLGRPNDVLIPPADPPEAVDYLVMESTYGGRFHKDQDLLAALAGHVKAVKESGGILLIPSFAVGRAQAVLYALARIFESEMAPRLPIFMNSPMATDVTELYQTYHEDHKLSATECARMCRQATYVNSVDESVKLCQRKGPMIIISASGMLTGGRVLHHLEQVLPGPENTLLLPGYQAPGTRGHLLMSGATELKLHGNKFPVKCRLAILDGFSAHADQSELLSWLGSMERRPKAVILNHGEDVQIDILRQKIEETLRWRVILPEYRDILELD
jgi:metallo-beta-lactamase family protein